MDVTDTTNAIVEIACRLNQRRRKADVLMQSPMTDARGRSVTIAAACDNLRQPGSHAPVRLLSLYLTRVAGVPITSKCDHAKAEVSP
jgi:hypothetical protein